jgi:hypothetical protein
MTAINHQNNFGTNLTSGTSSGATTSPLNSIPTIDAPFYLAFDATNINGHYEVLQITSKTATNVNHAALTYDHTTAEEVRCVCPAVEMDTWSAALNTTTWTDWTPTFTNFTKGSATIVAKYTQIGKTVHARLKVVLAADSSVSGAIVVTLPVTKAAEGGISGVAIIGNAGIFDANVGVITGIIVAQDTTTCIVQAIVTSGAYAVPANTSSTVPMTWTTGDEFAVNITYEAA